MTSDERTEHDLAALTDAELLELLRTEDDELPRTVVDEFVKRGARMIEPLSAICRDDDAWSSSDSGWELVHAPLILGAIGTTAAIPGLLSAVVFGDREGSDYVCDALIPIFGAVGPAAAPGLRALAENRDLPQTTRWLALRCLGGVAARHADRRDGILDGIRQLTDSAEPRLVRGGAGDVLLDFLRPKDKDLLLLVGAELKRDSPIGPIFDADDVVEAYSKPESRTQLYANDWLEFYEGREIERRATQRRRRAAEHEVRRPVIQPIAPARPKAGRNDPCPCGSGKKYKKCCLDEDEAAARPPPLPPQQPTADTPRRSDPDWLDVMDGLAAAPLKLRIEKVRLALEDSTDIDGDTAWELLNPIVNECRKSGRLEELDSLLDFVERRQPKAFAAEAGLFHTWRAQNALLRPGGDPLPHLLALAKEPIANTDELLGMLEWLRYAGRDGELAATLEAAWPPLRASAGNLVPSSVVDEFRHIALASMLGRRLEATADLRGDEPDLCAAAAALEETDVTLLVAAVTHMAGRGRRVWIPDDFARDEDGQRSMRLHLASLDFAFELHARHGWPRTRAELGRFILVENLLDQSILPGPAKRAPGQRKRGKASEPPPSVRFLLPRAAGIEQWVTGLVEGLGPDPHRVAALILAVPRWIDFLAGRQLVDDDAARSVWPDIRGRLRKLLDVFAELCDDPHATQDVRSELAR